MNQKARQKRFTRSQSCAIAGRILACGSLFAWLLSFSFAGITPSAGRGLPVPPASLDGWSRSFEGVVDRVRPTVVQVFTSRYSLGNASGLMLTKSQGMGSGVILDPGGYIITNAHVISGARRIQVLLVKGLPRESSHSSLNMVPQEKKREAKVVGVDLLTDLAVLKIEADGLPALALADSDQLRQGQLVLAFGSPLGLGNTVTMGMVSAIERQIKSDDVHVYVQTDAPINPGNSGGPLVDSAGNLVGINTMILSQSGGSEGVGLAIPSKTVSRVYEQIRKNGRVRRGGIGIQLQNITPAMAEGLGLPQSWGVIVSDIGPDSPAAKAGLAVGDVILNMDGRNIENVRQFGMNIYRQEQDTKVLLQIQRGLKKFMIQVSVVEKPDDPGRFLELVSAEKNLIPKLGILALEVDDTVEKLLAAPLRKPGGVLVASINPEIAPSECRLGSGDVIHSFNRRDIDRLEDLRQAAGELKSGDPAVIQVERDGALRYLVFEVD